MKKTLKKAMRMTLAFCLAAAMFCGSVADANAKKADYKKSFTKNINITGGLLQMTIDAKEDAEITVAISTKNKSKDLRLNAKMWYMDGSDQIVESLDRTRKKGSFKIHLRKGNSILYIENFTYDPKTYEPKSVKVKIKVSTKDGKVLRYGGKEIMEDVG